jgi:tRNA(Ile)-lysidine synthase
VRGLDLAALVRPILDRRLIRNADEPIAVALSGGGDSLALALLAAEWAKDADRPLLILTVDHRLRRESAAWTEACRATAQRLGAAFQALSWDQPKPATGLAAAARAARHRLLADAARRAGARVILMGHTGSDVAEAAAMRQAGSTTPDPKDWGPSPAWPQGHGLFLLRPLLGVSRAEVRGWLQARGETWIDDPANADPKSARVQARAATADGDLPPIPRAGANPLGDACRFDAAGGVRLARSALRKAPPDDAVAFIGMAAVCAGGGDKRSAGERLQRLAHLLLGTETVTASLAGARIEADDEHIYFVREAGEARRGGLTSLYLTPDQAVVWDGRFEFTATRPGLYVERLEGRSRKLDADVKRAVMALPASARPGLPTIVEDGRVACPTLEPVAGVSVTALVHGRLVAACGLIEREPA